jgi:hypothetical protein
MLPLAGFPSVPTSVWLTFAGAALISLAAFVALILAPAFGSFGRTWEKVTAALLSLFLLAALVLIGLAIGALIFLHWDQISGWVGAVAGS